MLVRDRYARQIQATVICGVVVLLNAAVFFTAVLLVELTPLGTVISGVLWGSALTIATSTLSIAHLLPFISVIVPQVQGLVTQDWWNKKDVAYGPGFHWRYITETVTRKSHFSLDLFAIPFQDVSTRTKTYRIKYEGWVLLRAALPRAVNFIRVDESVVRGGFVAKVKSFLGTTFNKGTGDIAQGAYHFLERLLDYRYGLKRDLVRETGDDIFEEHYGSLEDYINLRDPMRERSQFEHDAGVDVQGFAIEEIDQIEQVAKAQDAGDEQRKLQEGVARMFGLDVEGLQAHLKQAVVREGLSLSDVRTAEGRMANYAGQANLNSLNIEGVGNIAPALGGLLGALLSGAPDGSGGGVTQEKVAEIVRAELQSLKQKNGQSRRRRRRKKDRNVTSDSGES
jgi:hypothetical protein